MEGRSYSVILNTYWYIQVGGFVLLPSISYALSHVIAVKNANITPDNRRGKKGHTRGKHVFQSPDEDDISSVRERK